MSRHSEWLTDRARELARQYFTGCKDTLLNFVLSDLDVGWSAVLSRSWAKSDSGLLVHKITLSTRLADMPQWVIDAVLIHELAHQLTPREGGSHDGEGFGALVTKYPDMDCAMAFLAEYEITGRAGEAPPRSRAVERS